MWWRLRETLDPDYGLDLALPSYPKLQADLTAPTYTVWPGLPPRIYVESKADIMKLLGRSPDRGDAVVYGWNAGKPGAGPRARTQGRSAIRPTTYERNRQEAEKSRLAEQRRRLAEQQRRAFALQNQQLKLRRQELEDAQRARQGASWDKLNKALLDYSQQRPAQPSFPTVRQPLNCYTYGRFTQCQ